MAINTKKIGPWKLGRDAFHANDPSSEVYAGYNDQGARLLSADNIDVDDSGRLTRRNGTAKVLDLTKGMGAYADDDVFLVQDGGTINTIDTSATPHVATTVVSGLSDSNKVIFHRHADKIFWSNKAACGWIRPDGTATNWGVDTPPPPQISASSGGKLRPGRYLVCVSGVDANGIEHSASKSSTVTLNSSAGIRVSPQALDPLIVSVRIYASRTNDDAMMWVADVPIDELPYTIKDVEVSTEPVETQNVSPPIPPDCMFSYRGAMMIGVENAVFSSVGAFAHLFDIAYVQDYYTAPVLAGGGLEKGFWVVTSKGAFWTTGDKPENWDTMQKSDREFCAGSLVLPGHLIPALEVKDNVVLFVSEDGLTAGTASGDMVQLTPEREVLDVTGKTASIIYRKHKGSGNKLIRQILYSLG